VKLSLPRQGAALFAWQDGHGTWNFSIVERAGPGRPTLHQVQNNALRGLDELKNKISTLPDGYLLVWARFDFVEPEKGKREEGRKWNNITIPPAATLEEVKAFAAAHHVEVVVCCPR
jgi:hypothetical protein